VGPRFSLAILVLQDTPLELRGDPEGRERLKERASKVMNAVDLDHMSM